MKTKIALALVLLMALAACSPDPTVTPTETQPLPTAAGTIATATQPAATAVAEPTAVAEIPTETLPAEPTAVPELISIAAKELAVPWEVIFLPEGDMLVTERPGTLVRIGTDGHRLPIEGVHHVGEGGLMGLVLHPNFAENHWLYLYLTSSQGGQVINRVERYVYQDGQLSDRVVILDNIPGSPVHDGGRMEFGPDGLLYITTGDASVTANAQNLDSLSGKILRLNDDGSLPPDNPFGTAVYSYGHRNPQGLAWDEEGRLWSTEHGPSGLGSGFDELNLIEPGQNYGWPTIQGDQEAEGMVKPVLHSGANETWAPGDVEIIGGMVYFTGLRGRTLYAVPLDDIRPESLQRHFAGEYGRLRALRVGPDGLLYMSSSNMDGRGNPIAGDDHIYRVDPAQLP